MFFLVIGPSGGGKSSVRKLVEAEIAGQVAVCELGNFGDHARVETSVAALEVQDAGQ